MAGLDWAGLDWVREAIALEPVDERRRSSWLLSTATALVAWQGGR